MFWRCDGGEISPFAQKKPAARNQARPRVEWNPTCIAAIWTELLVTQAARGKSRASRRRGAEKAR
jgi:hypothetical protein